VQLRVLVLSPPPHEREHDPNASHSDQAPATEVERQKSRQSTQETSEHKSNCRYVQVWWAYLGWAFLFTGNVTEHSAYLILSLNMGGCVEHTCRAWMRVAGHLLGVSAGAGVAAVGRYGVGACARLGQRASAARHGA
jgi:hypothetical protein